MFDALIFAIPSIFSFLIYKLTFFFAWIASGIMAISLKLLVFEMGSWINSIPSIRLVWTFFRDLANLSFIFILLYAAISTILDRPTQIGRTLAKLVIVAVIINFSFFFISFIVDVSNYIGFEIYNSIKVTVTDGDGATPDQVDIETEKITTAIMNTAEVIRVDTYNFLNPENPSGNSTMIASMGKNQEYNSYASQFMRNVFSTILMIVLTFVFGSAAVLFLHRFLLLTLAIVISPVMFAMIILPSTEKRFYDWLQNKVVAQAFWFPLFMFFLYLGLQVISDPSMMKGMSTLRTETESSILVFASYIIQYGIVMSIFLGSLFAAKKIGVAGVDFATKVAGGGMIKASSWAGRNTIGRSAEWIERRYGDDMRIWNNGKGIRGALGNFAYKKVGSIKDAKYDFKNTTVGKLSQTHGKFELGKATEKTFSSVQKEKEERVKFVKDILGKNTKREQDIYNANLKNFKTSKPYKNKLQAQQKIHNKKVEEYKQELDTAIRQDLKKKNDAKARIEVEKKKAVPNQTIIADQLKIIDDAEVSIKEKRKGIDSRYQKEIEELSKVQKEELDKFITENGPKSAGQLRLDGFEAKTKKRTVRQKIADTLKTSKGYSSIIERQKTKANQVLAEIDNINTEIERKMENLTQAKSSRDVTRAQQIEEEISNLQKEVSKKSTSLKIKQNKVRLLEGWGSLTQEQIDSQRAIRRSIKKQKDYVRGKDRELLRLNNSLNNAMSAVDQHNLNEQIKKVKIEIAEGRSNIDKFKASRTELRGRLRIESRDQGSWGNQRLVNIIRER